MSEEVDLCKDVLALNLRDNFNQDYTLNENESTYAWFCESTNQEIKKKFNSGLSILVDGIPMSGHLNAEQIDTKKHDLCKENKFSHSIHLTTSSARNVMSQYAANAIEAWSKCRNGRISAEPSAIPIFTISPEEDKNRGVFRLKVTNAVGTSPNVTLALIGASCTSKGKPLNGKLGRITAPQEYICKRQEIKADPNLCQAGKGVDGFTSTVITGSASIDGGAFTISPISFGTIEPYCNCSADTAPCHLLTDGNNCGACGHKCGGDKQCINGSCRPDYCADDGYDPITKKCHHYQIRIPSQVVPEETILAAADLENVASGKLIIRVLGRLRIQFNNDETGGCNTSCHYAAHAALWINGAWRAANAHIHAGPNGDGTASMDMTAIVERKETLLFKNLHIEVKLTYADYDCAKGDNNPPCLAVDALVHHHAHAAACGVSDADLAIINVTVDPSTR